MGQCQWIVREIVLIVPTKLGIECLRCKPPALAIKEPWVYLLWIAWRQRGGGTHDAVSINALLVLIAEPRVDIRPGRVEPRALKRSPKRFPLIIKARHLLRTPGYTILKVGN